MEYFYKGIFGKVKKLEGFQNLKFYYKLYRFEIDEEKFEELYSELEEKKFR